MLASAIRHLDEHGKSDDRVYAVEGAGNRRVFRIMSASQVWQATSEANGSAHFYEVLTGPCDLYLDIEWFEESGAPIGERARVQTIVDHVLQCLRMTYGEQETRVTLASASGYSKGRYKCSWHVHVSCARVCWVNTVAVGQFVRDSCAAFPEVDKIPYAGKGQNWRCVGSSKLADPKRIFLPADQATFLGCTVQRPVGDRSLVYPQQSVPGPMPIAVPGYIADLMASLCAGGTPIMCSEDRCIVPFRERQWCEHVNRKHHSNHQYAVLNTRTLMWKMNCHACTDAISVWRTFPYAVAKRAFDAQCQGYVPSAITPAVRSLTARAELFDLLSHGPPPPRSVPVQCADGIYMHDEATER